MKTKQCNTTVKFPVTLDNTLTPTMDWIIYDDDPRIRVKCAPVQTLTTEDNQFLNKMISYIDTCYQGESHKHKIKDGIAIAAPQVGWDKRVIYLNFDDETNTHHNYLLVNPEIVATSEAKSFIHNGEGCLSVKKDVVCNIPRNYKIIVEGYDLLTQQNVSITATELLSICLQHEIDHLDGILYTDHIDPKKPKYISADWFKVN